MSKSEKSLSILQPGELRLIPHLRSYTSIKPFLEKMANREYKTAQILSLLRKFKKQSTKDCYGQKHEVKKVSFEVLLQFYWDIIHELFAEIAKFILRKSEYKVPLLKKNIKSVFFFNKQTILYLICMMALCLIPKQEYHEQKNKNYAYQLDFSHIFSHSEYETKTVVEYLRKELVKTQSYQQKLSISRVSTVQTIQALINKKGALNMCKIKLKGDNQSIQDYFGCLKIDFANSYIGGGALGTGCVQQEIMFSNHPELFITPLICERMQQNEAIFLIGFKKYFCNSVYSYKTQFLGPQIHKYEYDQLKRAKEYISAIDALPFPKNSKDQFVFKKINRQILKCYTGLNVYHVNKIATGNWGCGAFGGDLRTKLLIQWISCSLAEKQLIYCPFGQRKKLFNAQVLQKNQKLTVKDAYKILLQACRNCYYKSNQNSLEQVNIYKQLKFNKFTQDVKQKGYKQGYKQVIIYKK